MPCALSRNRPAHTDGHAVSLQLWARGVEHAYKHGTRVWASASGRWAEADLRLVSKANACGADGRTVRRQGVLIAFHQITDHQPLLIANLDAPVLVPSVPV